MPFLLRAQLRRMAIVIVIVGTGYEVLLGMWLVCNKMQILRCSLKDITILLLLTFNRRHISQETFHFGLTAFRLLTITPPSTLNSYAPHLSIFLSSLPPSPSNPIDSTAQLVSSQFPGCTTIILHNT